ncbi:MAG: glycerol-3-phosphate dehydrogenase/oxidase [Candidatus Eisenbacteria bacterium]|nr:glycerol-3-phosphate dehydrogenase/oxidase [Candidatus Eisenbacteria bacterium]
MSEPLDLLVLGGGITGLGIARLAALNHLRVVLIERGDLASGTSSVSSHMLHGGLRYLEHGRLHLVREALIERAALSRMAPALARPRRFVVPLYRGGRLAPWKLRLGLRLYDFLAGARGLAPYAMARPREALELEPALAAQGLQAAGVYSDLVMDDARLAIAVARDAEAHGARIHTYFEPVAAHPGDGGSFSVTARDTLDGTEHVFECRAIVNATGPWCDATRRFLSAALAPGSLPPAPLLRPSRGTHLIYPALTNGHGLLLTARADGRVFFVVPFGDYSLVGTTEIEIPSPPAADSFRPTLEEVRYLRAELARAMPGCAASRPLAVLAGLRPLLASDEAVGHASREHRVIEERGVFTIAGGKYTTFRAMARETLERMANRIGRRVALHDSDQPLPLPIVGPVTLEEIAAHAVEHEFARRIEDVLRRRTLLWLAPDRGRVPARMLSEFMGRRLGWSDQRMRDEVANWDASRYDEDALLARVPEEA